MRREFTCDARAYQVDERSVAPVAYDESTLRISTSQPEWVLRFWDAEGTDIGSIRNRTRLRITEGPGFLTPNMRDQAHPWMLH